MSIIVLNFRADYVDEKICDFLEYFADKLQKFSNEEYKTYVSTFVVGCAFGTVCTI